MKEFVIKTQRSKAYLIFFTFVRFSVFMIFKVLYRMKIYGRENIPPAGGIILCSNHLSYIDPVFTGLCIKRYVYFMAKIQLFSNKFVASVVTFFNAYPVNRESFDRQTLRNSVEILKAGQMVGIYPEGTRSTDGIIRQGHKGVGVISIMSESPILPVAIAGSNMIIRKPHKRLFFPVIKIAFGKPIDTVSIQKKYGSKQAAEIITSQTMAEIKKLYEGINNAG